MPMKPFVRFRFINGTEIELYYISTLAIAIGRGASTVRKWEISGVIPPSLFKDKKGNRLYSQEQIDAIVACAEKANIKQGMSIANTSFAVWVHKEMNALKDKYLKMGIK